MSFEPVDVKLDAPALERAILELWSRTRAFERLREKNRGGQRWSFIDGPITANNPMGVHHAWGRAYKDAFQRYFAMNRRELRYQNGFDCQGLWIEVEVERELKRQGVKLESKQDIESLVPGDAFASIDRFVQLCKERADTYARIQTRQSIRLGYWMDWDGEEDWRKPPDQRRSYFTMSDANNYAIWSFLKKCHDRGFLYRAHDSMPWCPRCEVGLSQMEVAEGYQLVAHRAVFVRFPLRGRPNENLLVWTTTPWTLSSNVGVAVNPALTYLKLSCQGQVYYVGKTALTGQRLEEAFRRKEWIEGVPKLKTIEQRLRERGGYEVLAELPGAAMVGWTYDGPFDELPAQARPGGFPREIADVAIKRGWASATAARDAHRVIAWDTVSEAEGTGLVHIAPGCGKEDFELGRANQLPPVAPIAENGVFLTGTGGLEGRSAADAATAEWITEQLRQKELLFGAEAYPHNYPHCWRCKTGLLFRLVDEWYISMSWRDEIVGACSEATWLPAFGLQRELDWLKNMGDWMISKKRYWGLALPIWVCGCGEFEVIGSREELHSRATAGWAQFSGRSPHRPWIDQVTIRCAKCGGTSSRIPDVGNPWLDAGIVPFSTLGWPDDREQWSRWFPADFVVESFPGQFRNWFYSLLAMSTMLAGRSPFKNLLGHALVRDQWGRVMHKSEGNAIAFEGVADEGYQVKNPSGSVERHPPMGADLVRWMFLRHNPANNINFGAGPADELRAHFVFKLWNSYSFFCNYARLDAFDPNAPAVPVAQRPDIDRWLLAELQELVAQARRSFEGFDLMTFCLRCEQFVDECLSNWYVRRNRRRFWKSEAGRDKLAAYHTLHSALVTLAKLIAPIMPFLAEELYQNCVVRPGRGAEPDSVHLCEYPSPDLSLSDPALLSEMDSLLSMVSLGKTLRAAAKIKVRQPLAEVHVLPADDRGRQALQRFSTALCEELNVKQVVVRRADERPLFGHTARLNMKPMGPRLGAHAKAAQAALAERDASVILAALNGPQPVFELRFADQAFELRREDLIFEPVTPAGWGGLEERGTQVLLDTRVTPELAAEGIAREAVRQVQELRKASQLQMEDRIELHLGAADESLRAALRAHAGYIASETLAERWSDAPLPDGAHAVTAVIDGRSLSIQLRKLERDPAVEA